MRLMAIGLLGRAVSCSRPRDGQQQIVCLR